MRIAVRRLSQYHACVVLFLLIPVLVLHPWGEALAQNPLGVGAGESAPPSFGMFTSLLLWVNAQQEAFYRSLSAALKAMRAGEGGLWVMVGLSFAYGVFHAAGPGHGKAVITSYMLANELALRRGIMLSFLSSLLQGITAVAVMGLVFLVLRGTSVSMGDATRFLEVTSFGLIAAFGAWLLWRKFALARMRGLPVPAPATAHRGHNHHEIHRHHDQRHHYADGGTCPACGHSHAPDPSLISADRLDWKSAWTAIAAVGIRPCSGALIVLTFAFLNQIWLGGLTSVAAMSIGTAITVSALATLAVTAKNVAMRFAGGGVATERVHSIIEIIGAASVMLIGLLLFSAAISV